MDKDGTLAHDSPSLSFMDLDFMDELFSDGCWLETTEGFDSSQPYIALDESSLSLANADPHEETYQKETEHNLTSRPISDLESKELTEFRNNSSSVEDNKSSVQSEGFQVEGGELSRSVWIGPSSVKQRLMDALRHLRQYTKDTEVLVQIWVPTKKGDKRVLTTIDQPCLLGLSSESLVSYRYVSENYHFQVDEDSKDFLGLPGRVFLRKLPESTPDVRFFRTEEYPRKSYAKQYNISGSFAVPVFERGTGTCLGVVEVVTTSQNISYRPELETICKALEAFDLRSSHDFCPPSVKACKEFCQAAVPEISEILGSVCKKYKLPLALMWARCFKQGKGGCRHFDEKFADCISMVDSACCVADRDLYEFHIASSELYLSLGQGIVGKAFVTSKQCFAADITAFSKTDYPLSHHAKVLNLHAAVAIPLRSIHGGSVDFVLELFLPKDCRDAEEQKRMWDLLPTAVQEGCQNLHVVMEKELEKDISWRTPAASDGRYDEQASHKFASPSKGPSPEGSSWISMMTEAQHKGEDACVSWDDPKESTEVFEVATQHLEELHHNQAFSESRQLQQNSTSRNSFEDGTSPSSAGQHSSGKIKVAERRRTKTEKTISLEVLRKHFAGSLKDAAKSIGVCPTTLKRICRQHGITRWPSRKLKKVDHSLKRLQLVIDSVQGAEGSIQIGSFYTTFPELTSPQFGGSNHFTSSKMNDDSKPLDLQPDNRFINAGAAAVKSLSSSCSHSSGSSTDFSTGEKHKINNSLTTGDGMPVEDLGGVVKRTRSEAELQALYHKESKPLARSRSHKIVPDHASIGTLSHFPSCSNQYLQDAGTFRVKASFREDKIRFRMQPCWNFKELQRELVKRFSIRDVCRIDLKYLDDDHEWVLLTCDADLDECKDIFRVSQSNTIKISVNESPEPVP